MIAQTTPMLLPFPGTVEQIPTLRKAYERYLKAAQFDASEHTILGYYSTINRFESYYGKLTIDRISEDLMRDFQQRMLSEGLSNRTVNKHGKALRTILKPCAPRDDWRNPGGLGIIDRLPWAKPLKENAGTRRRKWRLVTEGEINALYRGARIADRPKRTSSVPPPLAWRTAFVLVWTYGLRRGDLFRLTRTAISIDPLCPSGMLFAEHPHGWLSRVTSKTGYDLHLPLTAAAHQHIRELLLTHNAEKLFPGFSNPSCWSRELSRLQKRIGVERPVCWQQLRKTCNVQWKRFDSELGPAVLGQTDRSVNQQFYTERIPLILEYIERFPQPEAFGDL